MKRLRLKLIIGILILSGINVSAQTDYYKQAVDEICDMLNDKKTLDFKRAVFLTENAYYNGQLNYTEFCNEIDRIKIIITKMIEAKGLQKYKTAGNWAIFSFENNLVVEC